MRRFLAALGLAAALGGCGLTPQSPGEAETMAKGVYGKIAAGDLAGLKAVSTPELRGQETQALLDQMKAQIPAETATKEETTFWRVNANVGAPTQAIFNRLYTYPSGVVFYDVTLLLQKDKTWAVAGTHVQRQPPGVGQ